MNKRIFAVGCICTFLWTFIMQMSFGLPLEMCQFIDHATGHHFSIEILKMANGFYYDTDNSDMPTVIFLIIFALIFLLVFYLIVYIQRNKSNAGSLALIFLFALIFRFILLPSEPIHENDIYRYLWDGKSFIHQINPYKYAPADLYMYEAGHTSDYHDEYWDVDIKAKVFDKDDQRRMYVLKNLRDQNRTYYDRIGHWQVQTIYPPVTELIFAASSYISLDGLIFMKLIFVFFDIGILILIVLLLNHFKLNPCMSIIYAWSPLVIKEYPNSGHYDAIPVYFTLLAIYWIFKERDVRGVFALTLGALSKFFSVILLPILIRPLRISLILLFIIIVAAAYVPFMAWDQTGIHGIFQGFSTYNDKWFYNSSVFSIIYVLLDKYLPAMTENLLNVKFIVAGIFCCILCGLSLGKRETQLDILNKCFWATALLFILSPVGDPWYFCWVMPFLCFFPYKSWILLSGLLVFSYINFHTEFGFVGQRFLNIPVTNWLIYVPFFLSLLIESIFRPKFTIQDRVK